jgi:5'-nucleotidase/UDP-sugar diphosphatase
MRFLLITIFFLVSTLASAQRIILLHTNDHHGHFMASLDGDFGMAAQATLIKEIREEAKKSGAHVLLISAGDVNTGPPESNLFHAQPDFEAMNLLGYEAMTPGNHEFDRPFSVLKKQEGIANFPFLSENIVDENGKNVFTPYIVKEYEGKKIAIVGFTTPDTPKITPRANTAGLTFRDPTTGPNALVQRLKQENNMVIGLSHLGYFENESHGVNAAGDETLAKKVPELDVIVGGHTHTELSKPVKIGNTFIVQAKESGNFVGRMDIDLSSGKPVIDKYELIPVKGYTQDPEVVALLRPYLNEGEKKFDLVVGKAEAGFSGPRADIVKVEHPAGNFVAEAQRQAAGADITVVRGKSMRMGIPEGDIKLRHLLSLNPLGHVVVTAEFNGAEVWRFIQAAKDGMMVSGNRPYFSKGLKIEIADDKITKISFNGMEIPNSPTGKYKISTTDAIAEMVDEFSFVKDHPTYKSTGIEDVRAMESYLKKNGTLKAADLTHNTVSMVEALTPQAKCIKENLAKYLKKAK